MLRIDSITQTSVQTADKPISDRGIAKTYTIIAAVFLIAATLLLIYPGLVRQSDGFEMTVMDVGQGDAILICADGHSILIDGGARPSDATVMAENVILPYFRTLGIKKLDIVFNTHPDNDHIGGLFAVIDQVPTGALGVYDGYTDSERQQQLLHLAQQRNVPVVAVAAGQEFVLSDNLTITALSPQAGASYSEEFYNEGSLVLHIQYRDLDILTTGDLNGAEMSAAVSGLDCADIEVLQMPHHGSSKNYNADWYDNFNPQAVFISVGRNNEYGHPGSDVVDYWLRRGVNIYRTDQHGSCRITYENGSFTVRTVLAAGTAA